MCHIRCDRLASTVLIALGGAFVSSVAPAAVVISSDATQNMSCANGTCAPTAKDAVLNAGDLETLLASGNVTVTTTGSGVQAKDILVRAAVSWSTVSGLALDAYRSITIDKPVGVQGQAALTLTTNDGGRNGELLFGSHGNVTFANLSSSLTINGASYLLENSIKSLAAAIAANPSGDFALANSYDASQDGTYTTVPIPTTFDGALEGLGNAISNLSIDDANDTYVGLFAKLDTDGTLRDIPLKRPTISGSASGAALGGLVGDDEGAIFDVSATGVQIDAPAAYSVGGLVGCSTCVEGALPTIERAFASGTVTASASQGAAGGLVGNNSRGTIILSHASVHASGLYAGGLAGTNDGTITLSYATGQVPSGNNSGGLVGSSDSEITDSYATASVSGDGSVGGFLGSNGYGGTAAKSYSTGRIKKKSSSGYVGGFVGFDGDPGDMQSCYWDTDTSGFKHVHRGAGNRKDDPGITGLSSSQLQSGLPPGFDPSIWAENPNINDGLPYLIANPPSK